jgi:hypothetical protein
MAKTALRHPLNGMLYAIDPPTGLVRVSDPDSERYGLFDSDGVWYEGEIRDVDLQIAGWVGRTPEARRLRAAAIAAADSGQFHHAATQEGDAPPEPDNAI